ncbi:hypothetical protein LguiA_005658 [Lonicera macranthoides]
MLPLPAGEADDAFRTIYIFGDSTMDVGTNNYLNGSLATANRPYNGIDYPHSIPTGRFSNGYNTADLLASKLGDYKRSPPPFLELVTRLSTFKRDIMRGVNFASGGAGVFYDTGKTAFQIQQFSTVCGNITETLGSPAAANRLISNSLYIISVGSNDIFDYLRPNPVIDTQETLISNFRGNYTTHLQNLYNLGARKFGIIGVPPIGCTPAARVYNGSNCVQEANELAQAFYTTTFELLKNFSSQFQDVKYSLGNAYQMTISVIDNAVANGFKNITSACCGNGTLNAENRCEPGVNLCSNRDEYLFWDMYHPTQAASELASLTLSYAEGAEYVTPMNFSQLATL